MRNLFANIKHLKTEHAALEQEFGGGKGNFQSLWKSYKNNMAKVGGAKPPNSAYEDTDTK